MASTASQALGAAAWGVLSAVSLLIGAIIGVWRNPKKEIRAVFMAYGSGALIEALSIELFAHIVHLAEGGSSRRLASGNGDGPGKGLVYVAMGMAILGGSCFAGLNKVLNDAGGFARHAASLKEQVGKRRGVFYDRLAAKLQKIPIFAGLEKEELRQLASKMKKDVFEEGETIFHHEDLHSPIFFLLSGSVRVDVFRVPELVVVSRGTSRASSKQMVGEVADKLAMLAEKTLIDLEDPPPVLKARSSVIREVIRDTSTDHSYLVQPHQLFGELAFITGQSLSANATAVEVSKALKLLTHDFIDLVDESPTIKRFLVTSAAQSMIEDRKMNVSMETLMNDMEMVIFSADEVIYDEVDENTPIYYLILGHIRLTYDNIGDAYPSTQDPLGTSNKRIIRPGKLFGTDNFARNVRIKVTALAHDRALALCLRRDSLRGCTPPTTSKLAWSQAPPPDIVLTTPAPRSRTPSTQADEFTVPEGRDLLNPLDRDSSITTDPERCSPGTPLGNRRRSSTKESVGRRSIVGRMDVSVQRMESKPILDGDNQIPQISDVEVLEELDDEGGNGSTVVDSNGKEAEGGHGHGHSNNAHAATMIWLGILIDAVPESVVLGILASTSTSGSLLTFVIGVFLSNLPEAMSSSGTMHACGVKRTRIMYMWTSIVVLTGVGAALGAIVFPPGSEDKEGAQYAIAAIEGMCGGAMLTMIANTALPEAFEQGGNVVGLSTLFGFLSALFVSVSAS
jgi:CRP-like cAMP-binding protein/zinc transporter ZupT